MSGHVGGDPQLIEMITNLVIRELQGHCSRSSSGEKTPSNLLLVPCATSQNLSVLLRWISEERGEWLIKGDLKLPKSFLVQNFSGFEHCDREHQEWERWLESFERVLVFAPDVSFLGQVATLAAVDQCAQIALRAMLIGKPVYYDQGGWQRYQRHSSRINGFLVEKIAEHQRTLSDYGGTLVEFEEGSHQSWWPSRRSVYEGYASKVRGKSQGRDVVTLEDVERAHQRGASTIKVEVDAIVTALASQRVEELGMEVERG